MAAPLGPRRRPTSPDQLVTGDRVLAEQHSVELLRIDVSLWLRIAQPPTEPAACPLHRVGVVTDETVVLGSWTLGDRTRAPPAGGGAAVFGVVAAGGGRRPNQALDGAVLAGPRRPELRYRGSKDVRTCSRFFWNASNCSSVVVKVR